MKYHKLENQLWKFGKFIVNRGASCLAYAIIQAQSTFGQFPAFRHFVGVFSGECTLSVECLHLDFLVTI